MEKEFKVKIDKLKEELASKYEIGDNYYGFSFNLDMPGGISKEIIDIYHFLNILNIEPTVDLIFSIMEIRKAALKLIETPSYKESYNDFIKKIKEQEYTAGGIPGSLAWVIEFLKTVFKDKIIPYIKKKINDWLNSDEKEKNINKINKIEQNLSKGNIINIININNYNINLDKEKPLKDLLDFSIENLLDYDKD